MVGLAKGPIIALKVSTPVVALLLMYKKLLRFVTATSGRGLAKGPAMAQKFTTPVVVKLYTPMLLTYASAAALPADPIGLRTAARVAAQPRAFQLFVATLLADSLLGL